MVGKALLYFEIITTLALIIGGMVMAKVLRSGAALALDLGSRVRARARETKGLAPARVFLRPDGVADSRHSYHRAYIGAAVTGRGAWSPSPPPPLHSCKPLRARGPAFPPGLSLAA